MKEGIHVRSPLRFEGVPVGDEARVAFEERWLKREQGRIARKQKEEAEKSAGKTPEPEDKEITISSSGISTNALPTEPRFVSEAYFMDFKFEKGNYFLAGRETLSGQEVLKIQVPTRQRCSAARMTRRRRGHCARTAAKGNGSSSRTSSAR